MSKEEDSGRSESREIANLCRQKQNLIEQKRRLESQITKIDEESRRPIRAAVNPNILSQLDRDYRALKGEIAKQKSELEEIRGSDAAAHRSELQEEAKVVYLEMLRLQDLENAQKQELQDVTEEYEDLVAEDGPEATRKRQERLAALKVKLVKYERANHKLAARIKAARANKAFDNDEGRERVAEREKEVESEIEDERVEYEKLQEQVEETKRKHRQELRLVRARK